MLHPILGRWSGEMGLPSRRASTATPRSDPVTGVDLGAAVDALSKGEAISPDQRPSIGCNIKWKAGNEPDYFG